MELMMATEAEAETETAAAASFLTFPTFHLVFGHFSRCTFET